MDDWKAKQAAAKVQVWLIATFTDAKVSLHARKVSKHKTLV